MGQFIPRPTRAPNLSADPLECIFASGRAVREANGSSVATEGKHNRSRDRGARFPLCAETAAEIARTINPNGYHRSPINRPAPPPYETLLFHLIFFLLLRNRRTRRSHTDEHAAASVVADAAEDHRAGRIVAARASAAHLRPFPVSFSPTSRTSIDLGFHCSSCSSSSSLFFSSADSPDLAIDYLVPHQCLATVFWSRTEIRRHHLVAVIFPNFTAIFLAILDLARAVLTVDSCLRLLQLLALPRVRASSLG